MKASFKINAEQEIQVEPAAGQMVLIRELYGVWFDGEDTRRVTEMWFKKTEARAIASAMMGCAAEV